MAKKKMSDADKFVEDIIVKVDGESTKKLIEKLQGETFLSCTTPEEIKKAVKFYVGQTIISMREDAKKHTLRPENVRPIDYSSNSAVRSYQNGECTAEEFVERLMMDMNLELLKLRTSGGNGGGFNGFGGMGMGMPGMMGGMGMANPPRGLGAVGSAATMAKVMSGEAPDTLDKLMIIKTMSEHLEKETAGVELECAHKLTNCVLDSISEISLSKKTELAKEND